MEKIIIAPNSFKECADSVSVTNLIYNSLEKLSSRFELVRFPISDGGDGFLDVIKFHFSTTTRFYNLHSFWNGKISEYPVEYCLKTKTVFIETAKIIGLNLIPLENRNPLKYNSSPIGELLKLLNGERKSGTIEIEKVVLGIGGTATNDLGVGMLTQFGMKLFDADGIELIPVPDNFLKAARLKMPDFKPDYEIELVLDVENPLTGENGATRIFGPQKGAGPAELRVLESGFENLILLMRGDADKIKILSGAGGGIAAAFQMFMKTDIIYASQFVTKYLGLNKYDAGIKLAITGEGRFDGQTLLNKGGMIIYNHFSRMDVPVFFMCGEKNLTGSYKLLDVLELKDYFSCIEESILRFPEGVAKACREIETKI